MILLSISNAMALVLVEPYGYISFGDEDFQEVISGTTRDHDAILLGAGIGLRVGFEITLFEFGLVAEYAKNHLESSLEDPNAPVTGTKRYDNTLKTTHYGYWAGIKIPTLPLRAFVEYYPEVNGKFTYAGPDSANPFSQSDKLRGGQGFGVGLSIGSFPVRGTIVLRQRTFDQAIFSGTKTALSKGDYPEDFVISEFLMMVSIPISI